MQRRYASSRGEPQRADTDSGFSPQGPVNMALKGVQAVEAPGKGIVMMREAPPHPGEASP